MLCLRLHHPRHVGEADVEFKAENGEASDWMKCSNFRDEVGYEYLTYPPARCRLHAAR